MLILSNEIVISRENGKSSFLAIVTFHDIQKG